MANPEEREGEEGEVRRRAALFFDIESWIARFLAVCPKSWSVALASFPFLALSSHSVTRSALPSGLAFLPSLLFPYPFSCREARSPWVAAMREFFLFFFVASFFLVGSQFLRDR